MIHRSFPATDLPKRWCILRTAPARTLKLAESLAEAGFDVWTPIQTKAHQLRGGKKGTVSKSAPILPTFVFARAHQRAALLAEVEDQASAHPQFSLFRYLGKIVEVSDGEIDRLRHAENQTKPRAMRPTLPVGSRARPVEGPYAGMTGHVEHSKDGTTKLHLGGWMTVKFDTLHLEPVNVEGAQPLVGIAA